MASEPIGPDLGDIRVGNLCLMSVMNQHFMVEILETSDDSLRVSFPGSDYPVAGMVVDLEFHDKLGFNCYRSSVLEGPVQSDQGVVLRMPRGCTRAQHRDSCRVSTDLTVQIKDQVHVRRYDAGLLNLSAGGALLETRAPFDFHTTVEMIMSLPGEPTHTVLGRVVHVTAPVESKGDQPRLVGLRFIGPDASIVQSIIRYIWHRLREIYPGI